MRLAATAVVLVVLVGCGDDVERSERSVCGQIVQVTVDGDTVEGAGSVPGEWRLTWWPDGADDLTTTVGALPLRTSATGDRQARVTTPDAACTAVVGVDPPSVRVVGDSLAFHVARAGLGEWQGTPGASWASTSGDPAVAAIDEIRGAVADAPDVLVLIYGANDALWTAGDDTGSRREVVAASIDAALAEAASVPCVRVVTPSAGPTVIFGLGERFTAESEAIAELLRQAAPDRVVDWTAVSADHHLPDGDEIHPTDEGRQALVDLVDAAVAAC